MKSMTKKLSFLIVTALVLINSGCSSDSGSGSSITNATITDDNAVDLATAGTEGVKQAVNNDSYNPFAAAKTANPSLAQKLTVSVAQQASQDPALATNFCETGSVIGFDTLGENGGTITYDKCVIGGATIDGTMIVITKSSGDTYTYTITADITITYLNEVENFDYSASCTFNQTSGTASCTYNSTALGIDDRNYSVSNISVGGDGISGYTVSATVTDPDHGNITISTSTPVTFNCTNGQPDSGEIIVSDGSRSMTVTFIDDCNSFSINFNGSTTTHNW